MNCKPGDLAVIVSAHDAHGIAGEVARRSIGAIVRVTKLRRPSDPHCWSSLVWGFEKPLIVEVNGTQWSVTGCADSELLPIRPDDGADETLSWLAVPNPELESIGTPIHSNSAKQGGRRGMSRWALDQILGQCIEVGDCLEWQGRMGCGRCSTQPIYKTRIAGKSVNVPVCRELWQFTKGPVPAGKIVYRKCCNDRCVGCLALGVRGDAMRQRKKLGLTSHTPATRASITSGSRRRPNVRNSMEKAREVRSLAAENVPRGAIAERTGVHPDMVADILQGRSWLETSHASSVFSWRPA